MSSKAPILGSFAATAAILAGGFWYVNHRQTSHHESPPPPAVAGSLTDLTPNQSTRIEPPAPPEVPTAPGIEISDFVAVASESIASRSQGRMKSAEENAHQDNLSRRIAALNPVQLENLVAELATCDALARDERGWWIMMSLNSMAEADLEKALAVWKANVGTIKGSIWVAGSLSTLIGKFATKSPTKAFAKLQEAAAVAPGINVAQVTTNGVQTIARSDFATALGLMESHIEPLGPTAVRDVLSVAMMPSNGDRFLEITRYMNGYLTRCKNPAAGEELERNLLSSIGSSLAPKLGYQETERWMHQAGLSRQQYLAMGFFAASNCDGKDHGPWIDWFNREEPYEALSDEKLQEDWSHKARGLAMQWMSRDTASFGKWLEGQPQGQMKDMCIVEFTHEIARDHPDTAEKWVEQMGNDENRNYMFRQIQQKANFSSPEEEKAFADRHGL